MTTVKLNLISDCGVERFDNFTGVIPRVGESVVFYKRQHDGRQYTGVVSHVHYRIEYEIQNDPRNNSTIETIDVNITERKPVRDNK